MTLNIHDKPTYDLEEITFLHYEPEDKLVYFESKLVYKFDKCSGTIEPRSKICRNYNEIATLTEDIIGAVLDANYTGQINFKVKLTEWGNFQAGAWIKMDNHAEIFEEMFAETQQFYLHPFQTNYYNGTNQTDLKPDVVFVSE
jgi:hypothetical protein